MRYFEYLPKVRLSIAGSSSTDTAHQHNSVPSSPFEIPRPSWGHQRTWSTGILGDQKNFIFPSNDDSAA